MTGSPSGAHKEDLMQPLTKRHLCSFTVTSRAHKEDPMQTLAALEPRVQVFSQAASLSWCQSSAALPIKTVVRAQQRDKRRRRG